MRPLTRFILEAVVFLVAVGLLLACWAYAFGYMQTRRHLPDIISRYESVDELQAETAFGAVFRFDWFTVLALVLLIGLYAAFRWGIGRLVSRKRSAGSGEKASSEE